MASTLTLPPFFTEWVGNGVREWMDANKVPCIPKVRVAEVEVDIVCYYYGLEPEISKYIQRLAFSKHLPFTMPTSIYTLVSPRANYNPTQLRGVLNVYCELGRDHSILRSEQGGCATILIPNGKFRNEAKRFYTSLIGTQECKARIFNGCAYLDENGRGYENMYRKFKGIKSQACWSR